MDFPNLPEGLTLIGHNDGSVRESGGSAFGIDDFAAWNTDDPGNIVVTEDATNPSGSGQVLRLSYSDAFNPRCGSAVAESFTGAPFERLYVAFRIFLESSWLVGAKMFYWGVPGQANAFYTTLNASGHIGVFTQHATSLEELDSSEPPPDGVSGAEAFDKETWALIEFDFEAESVAGAGDGIARQYINGNPAGARTNIQWQSVGETRGFDQFQWYGDLNSGILTGTERYRIGELYIAGAAA